VNRSNKKSGEALDNLGIKLVRASRWKALDGFWLVKDELFRHRTNAANPNLALGRLSYCSALTQSRIKRRRLSKCNPCSRACRRHFSYLSARSLLAAAICPGDLSFADGNWASAAGVPIEISAAQAAEKIKTRLINLNSWGESFRANLTALMNIGVELYRKPRRLHRHMSRSLNMTVL
jgi:hypothetical protein